ncbi:Aldose reductase [Astathelohania contejeani]|uniref:Aldose reductase n=1 Tax=Astathelohania contejeani TaxID=164912 RepID=A0ABQ7I1E4_9MICR|nr:Aldose reductase [Thelohania contejeani]
MPSARLNNGLEIPLVGLGTWKMLGLKKLRSTIGTAIEIGYRHIDTAMIYGNEKDIGIVLQELIREGRITREELFITSKLWNSDHENPMAAIKRTLSDLQTEYLDLYLIHWPVTFRTMNGEVLTYDNNDPIIGNFDPVEVWKKMEHLVKMGYTKSIGVANFGIKNLTAILDNCTIIPAVSQFECHPYLKQIQLIDFCQKNHIQVVSHTTLGSSDKPSYAPEMVDDPMIVALAQKYNITPVQLILSYITTKNICVIPKSTNKEHLRENFNLVRLDQTTMDLINSINKTYRYVDPMKFGENRFL